MVRRIYSATIRLATQQAVPIFTGRDYSQLTDQPPFNALSYYAPHECIDFLARFKVYFSLSERGMSSIFCGFCTQDYGVKIRFQNGRALHKLWLGNTQHATTEFNSKFQVSRQSPDLSNH